MLIKQQRLRLVRRQLLHYPPRQSLQLRQCSSQKSSRRLSLRQEGINESVAEEEQEPETEPTEEVAVVDNEAQEDSADQDALAAEPPVPEPRTIETSDADTLLDIAQQVRPVASVTLQQTMLAIQALNPDAFIDDNINRMRSGQVLRVPNREEIEATDTSTAASEVARQNQAFADLQPLAAPAQDEPDTQAAPQDQLSVITAEDAAFDATSGAGELDDEQNAELDRRIAELENQLALRQEEADRARIEREELDSRLADLEAQIEAAQEIIRLQDMQLAQLQESLAEAAAEAEVVAAEEAALAAAQAEIAAAQAQPATGANLTDNIMRILTGNTIIIPFGVALVILLLVGLLLRRNRTVANDEEDELGGLDQQDFDADREQGAAADAGFEQAIENKAEADENDLDQPAADETDDDEPSLDAELDMAFDLGAIVDPEDSEEQQEEPQEEQQIDELLDEQSDSTKPEDLKTDDEIFILDESDEGIDGAASDKADDETIIEFDEESSAEQEAQESDSQYDKSESLGKDDDTVLDLDAKSKNAELTSGSAKEVDDLDIDAFEFDAGDFKTEDNSGEDSQAATKEDKLDLETFSFDTEDIPKPAPTAETEPLAADDENALDFDFDKAEIKRDSEADSTDEPEEIETFEFDGEPAESESNIDDGSVTADESDATEVDIDEVSFDIGEEIEAEEGREAGSAANSDDDEFDFDLDAEPEASAGSGHPVEEEGSEVELLFDDESDSGENTESGTETSVSADQDIEIDLDFDESPEVEGVAEKTEDAEEDDLGDLGFLSDDDEVEIESVDGVEEVSLMSDDDETATKLELAYAYQKMGDADGAREILQEVIAEGNEAQVKEAGELLVTLDDAD
jgi:pilus assembly protein FimV